MTDFLFLFMCNCSLFSYSFFFFFNDTATTEIYTLSLHDALPISSPWWATASMTPLHWPVPTRSEEHTSELQSPVHLVCRLLLEKKNQPHNTPAYTVQILLDSLSIRRYHPM